MPGVCAAPNCKYNTRKLHVFRFPRDVRRCNQWLVNCNRPDLVERSPNDLNTHCRLCEKHFEDDQFMNDSKSRLTWRAIPTIFEASDPPESEKRQKFGHSFPSARRKRIATLDQNCSADHTYFAALDKSARTQRMKTCETPHAEVTVCDTSGNMPLGMIDTRNNENLENSYECSGVETAAFNAINNQATFVAGSADTNNLTSYCNFSSFGIILDNRNQTENVSVTSPYIANYVAFQDTSNDAAFLSDGNIFVDSNVIGGLNANSNVIMFYGALIRDETIEDSEGSTANVVFEDSSSTSTPMIKFQEELKDGAIEGSLIVNSDVGVSLHTSLVTCCDSSSNDETMLAQPGMLPDMIVSVEHASLGSQHHTTNEIDSATSASRTVCASSRLANVSSRKRKRRKVAAVKSARGSVDHTYAASMLQKSLDREGDCSCETFSKEQGMMLVQKILSMQKEALVATKRSKTKSKTPTVESIVQGAIQLGMKDSTSRFFASQLRNCVRNNKGHRWSAMDKSFARDLFVKSKEAYKILEDFFHLPSAATLQWHSRGRNMTSSCLSRSDET